MKNVYLVGAIAGTVIPYFFFINHFMAEGFYLTGFVMAVFANGAAGGFAADLLITSFIFWCYLFARGERLLWLYILLNLTIGLSCALPAYLYADAGRTRNEID